MINDMKSDIILPVYNNIELTRKCLDSLMRNWRKGDGLIIINDGSQRETQEFLDNFKDLNSKIDIKIIHFKDNQGFIVASNFGLKESNKDCVCLLNNDTEVTSGWLDQMCMLMEKEKNIGIVNPLSSTFGLYPKKDQSIEQLARTLVDCSGQYAESASCVGFCMLIKKEVIEKVGVLDEVFGKGYFEDTDYCRRAIANGYRCVISKAAYVWHREHSTFMADDREELFSKNREIFHQRWGKPQRSLCVFTDTQKIENFAKFSNFCVKMARQGDWPWIVAPKEYKNSANQLQIHGNIRFNFVPKPFVNIFSLWLLFIRRKKKFDAVYLNKSSNKFSPLMKVIFKGKVKELDYEKKG